MTDKELLKMSDADLCEWAAENPFHSTNVLHVAQLLKGFPDLSKAKLKKALTMFREAVVDGKTFCFHYGEPEGEADNPDELVEELSFYVE